MFQLFKKKVEQIGGKSPVGVPEAVFDLDKEIIVHSMPPRFRASRPGGGQAKKTGLLILIVGFVFLIVLAAAAYYFLFEATPAVAPVASTTPESEPVAEQPKTEEPEPNTEINGASSTPVATSTIVATTSPELIATTSVTTIEPAIKNLSPAVDTDNDGLTDVEEAIIGSNSAVADSDGDGYGDLAELNNFYDPTGPGKLEASSRWQKYQNTTYGYSLLRPAIFTEKSLGGDYSISFVAPENQFFQLEVQPNTARSPITDWYREQFGESADSIRLLELKDANGMTVWLGIKSEDGLTVYFTDIKLSNIYTISYNVGLEEVSNYPNLFDIFIKSLALTK